MQNKKWKNVNLSLSWAENVKKAKKKVNVGRVAMNQGRKAKNAENERKPQIPHSESESASICA